MFITINSDTESNSGAFDRLIAYLKKNKIVHCLFHDRIYDVRVKAEDRNEAFGRKSGQTNSGGAWHTCATLVQVWDWDSMGRGPYPKSDYDLKKPGSNTAPRGKGWVMTKFGRKRVAGECANPTKLEYFNCNMSCPKYVPRNTEGMAYVLSQIADIHEQRAAQIRKEIERLKKTDELFSEIVSNSAVIKREVESVDTKNLPPQVGRS